MDYDIYDGLQAELGGVGDAFRSNVNLYLSNQQIPDESRELLAGLCTEFERSLNELSRIVSEALRATAK